MADSRLSNLESRRSFFPIFVDLRDKLAIVVGGGSVATRKVRSLLAAGARVSVIAPQLCEEMRAFLSSGEITWRRGEYVASDLEGATLVFAATDDGEANAAVYREATALGLLVNVVDDPEHCSFIVPSQVTRDGVCIAISTEGQSPALARRLREVIDHAVPPAYGELASLLGRLRAEVKDAVPEAGERGQRWGAVLDSDVLALIEEGRPAEAEALARAILGLPARAETEGR